MVFWEYTSKTKSGEYWITAEKLEARMQAEREKQQRWRDRNPDKSRELVKAYGKKRGKEFKAEKQARFYRNHPEVFNALRAKRKASKLAQTPATACHDTIRVFYRMAKRLSKCTGIPFHVDHIVPLAIGGHHHQRNLQALPKSINLRKGGAWVGIWPDGFQIFADNVRTKNPSESHTY